MTYYASINENVYPITSRPNGEKIVSFKEAHNEAKVLAKSLNAESFKVGSDVSGEIHWHCYKKILGCYVEVEAQ